MQVHLPFIKNYIVVEQTTQSQRKMQIDIHVQFPCSDTQMFCLMCAVSFVFILNKAKNEHKLCPAGLGAPVAATEDR